MSMSNTEIARWAHELNRAVQQLTGEEVSPHWEEAPDYQRNSSITGVNQAKLGSTPEQLHESWMTDKLLDGWTYGPTKDADRKEHPCLLPYNELPAEQRLKDAIFKAVVEHLS